MDPNLVVSHCGRPCPCGAAARTRLERRVRRLIQANYYPMVAQAYISDGVQELVALVDRTVGAASLAPGQFEVMLHRRCSQDDFRGVNEPLDDQTVVYPRMRFFAGTASGMELLRCESPDRAPPARNKAVSRPCPWLTPTGTIAVLFCRFRSLPC